MVQPHSGARQAQARLLARLLAVCLAAEVQSPVHSVPPRLRQLQLQEEPLEVCLVAAHQDF